MDHGESMAPRFEGERMIWELSDSGSDPGARPTRLAALGITAWALVMSVSLWSVEWTQLSLIVWMLAGPSLILLGMWILDKMARMAAARDVVTRLELSPNRLRVIGSLEPPFELDLARVSGVRAQIHPMQALVFEMAGRPLEVLAGDHSPAELEVLAARIDEVLQSHRAFLEEQVAAERAHGEALRGVMGAVSSRSESP